MTAAERREILERDHQLMVAMGRNLSIEDMEFVSAAAFPAGSLPDHPTPPKFRLRELEMFTELVWMTNKKEMQIAGGKMALGFQRRMAQVRHSANENQ